MPLHDTSLLQAALIGYQRELSRVEAAIAALEHRLGKRSGDNTPAPATKVAPTARKRHHISREGRARIAAAQRKRWAAHRSKTK